MQSTNQLFRPPALLILAAGSFLIWTAGCTSTKPAAVDQQERLQMARAYSAEKSGDALLVWIDREWVLEDYQNGYSPEKPHPVTEISTLFSSLMALAAVNDGLLSLDEPVAQTLTAWQDDPQKSTITVAQLLNLTSGLEAGSVRSVPTFDEAVAAPLTDAPGETFRYGPTAYQVFGAQKVGLGYLKRRVFEPIGIEGGRWQLVGVNVQEQISGESAFILQLFDGSNMIPRKLGRVGRLLLSGGRWEGEPIIDDLSPLTQPTDAGPGYGLGVWLNAPTKADSTSFLEAVPEDILLPRGQDRLISDSAPPDLFMAAGRYNQRLYVMPSKAMVVVRLGRANRTWDDDAFLTRLLDGRNVAPEAPIHDEQAQRP